MQYYINFHGNKLGPAGDFLLQKKKRPYSDIPSGLFKQMQKDFWGSRKEKNAFNSQDFVFLLDSSHSFFFSRSYDRLN